MRLRLGVLVLMLAVPLAAAAQGNSNGRGNAKGRFKGGPVTSPSGGGAAQTQSQPQQPQSVVIDGVTTPVSGTGVRNFGAWLDDASLLPVGTGSMSISMGWFRSPVFREYTLPTFDGGVGLTQRVQVGFSVPYYHANEPGGPVARGIGDLYLNAKIQLRDPAKHESGIGFAVTPVLEVLSSDPGPDGNRFNWALPMSMEVQGQRVRMFASTGYFSRGSLFASTAVEFALTDSLWATGGITGSYSTKSDPLSRALGLSKSRADVSGSVAYLVAPTVVVYGGVGRTISQQDANSASLVVSGGMSFSFAAWTPRETRK